MRLSKKKKRGRKKTRKWSNSLTDNVRANELLSPLYFFITYIILNNNQFSWDFLVFQYSFFSTLTYIYASNYFQPDLDIHHSRPGMGHFPLGRWVGEYRFGRALKMMVYPINRLWYWLWHPFGATFTHRGVGHWPVIGVWLRVGYLWLWAMFFQGIFQGLNFLEGFKYTIYIKHFLEMFYPWGEGFGTKYWFLFCFPVYLSDSIHILVDYIDSVKRGFSFCPPKIPRGWIAKNYQKIRKKIKKSKFFA